LERDTAGRNSDPHQILVERQCRDTRSVSRLEISGEPSLRNPLIVECRCVADHVTGNVLYPACGKLLGEKLDRSSRATPHVSARQGRVAVSAEIDVPANRTIGVERSV